MQKGVDYRPTELEALLPLNGRIVFDSKMS